MNEKEEYIAGNYRHSQGQNKRGTQRKLGKYLRVTIEAG